MLKVIGSDPEHFPGSGFRTKQKLELDLDYE